jgi:16S rRNA processing protein RimM
MADETPNAGSKTGSNLVAVGELAGAHGVKGWVKVKSSTEPEENIFSYSPWWLKTKHGVKKVEVDDASQRPQGLLAHIVGLDDRDEAAALNGVKIAVERSQLPELEAGEYYWHQLIGLTVISEYGGQKRRLGQVSKLLETGANDVLVVKGDEASIDDRERLIPYLPDRVVRSIDIEQGAMTVDWDPEF